jgi:hypothetical protein
MKVGDILPCCWGATMTLYDFYEVVGWTESKKSVYLRELQKQTLGGQQWNMEVQPIKGAYTGETKLCRIKDNYVKISSFQLVNLTKVWDGKEVYYENHMD